MKTFPHAAPLTESQEEQPSLFPFAVPSPRRLRFATSFFLGIALALLILSIPTASAQPNTHRHPAQDFNTLSGAGNDNLKGIWSDGETMWVADFQGIEDHEENKIYAYNLKAKSREAAKDFNTLNAAGNDRARGIWSDGKTMWVADQTDGKIYAYRSFAFRNPRARL